jgi:RNA polymerase sigma-70 factor (ECF subfamily)
MSESPDFESLMRQAQAGDSHAYKVLLKESVVILTRFLGKGLRNASEVEDVVQEVLISLHKARHTYDSSRPFKPWLFAIARFRLSEYWRRAYADKLRQAVDIAEIENTLAAPVTNSGVAYEYLREGLNILPKKQADIVRLIHVDGYTAKQAAAKLGMKESAVKVAAHRAYKVLRRKLNEE